MTALRRVPNEWLLGATAGSYITFSLALYCFGQGLFPPHVLDDPFATSKVPYSLDSHALLLLIPGLIVFALSALQIYFETIFKRSLSQGAVRAAVALNALGGIGLCSAIPLSGAYKLETIGACLALMALLGFVCGILLSITNILWATIRGQHL